MPDNGRQKCPDDAAGDGSRAKSERDYMQSVAPRRAACKLQPQDATRPIWPRPDNPFFRQLRENSNYVWDRMLASVARPIARSDLAGGGPQ